MDNGGLYATQIGIIVKPEFFVAPSTSVMDMPFRDLIMDRGLDQFGWDI